MSTAVDWSGLEDLGLTVRPISIWPGPATPAHERRESPFRGTVKVQTDDGERYRRRNTPMATTAKDLRRELEAIRATDPVLRLAVTDGDLRLSDGFPKARSVLEHPGVVVTLVARGVRGQPTLTYAVDSFLTWQDNLRAIALGMEAQRKLKRYGIAQSDQQYVGYRALPQVTAQTQPEARDVLWTVGGLEAATHYTDKQLFKAAAKVAQRDEGELNAVLNAARTLGVIT